MRRYVIRRVLQMLIVLFLVSVAVFFISRASGDVMHLLMPITATAEDYARVRHALGLDKPIFEQYGIYLVNVLQGDLGRSIRSGELVTTLIAQRFPNSLKLAITSMLLAVCSGIPLGVLAAVKRGKSGDILARAIAVIGQSFPHFWVAIILILVFAVRLQWLPTSGLGSPLHYVMPAFTLGFGITASILRLVRSGMLEVLDAEYIKLARIKGVPEIRVILVHALKNAMIAFITFIGMYFALFVGAAVIIETVFIWPGLGRLAYDATRMRDFPVIQGVVLLIVAVVLLVNLVVDVLYAYIDPRIVY